MEASNSAISLGNPNVKEQNHDGNQKTSDNGIQGRVKKELDLTTNDESAGWKETLSGALDDDQLLGALFVLGIFYIGLTFTNAYHKHIKKNEDEISEACTCKSEHQAFYIIWLTLCCVLWLVIQVVKHLLKIKCWKYFHCGQVDSGKDDNQQREICADCYIDTENCHCCCCTSCICCCSVCMYVGISCVYCCTCCGKCNGKVGCCNEHCGWFKKCSSCFRNCFSNCWKNVYTVIRLIKKWVTGRHFDLYQYAFYIVTQYYELYVIGISKNTKYEIPDIIKALMTKTETVFPRKKQKIRTFLKVILKKVPKQPTAATGIATIIGNPKAGTVMLPSQPNQTQNENKKSAPMITAVPDSYKQKDWRFYLQSISHVILKLTQFFAQLSVIPLLLIQMFDTYGFLCLAADSYCTMREEYRLHLHQTFFTFGFYCALTISFLASKMLNWIPFPKKMDSSTA